MSNHKPATALPWKFQAEGRVLHGILGSARLPTPHSVSKNNQGDAAYIAHSANAYPKLVESLKAMLALERAVAPTAQSRTGIVGNTDALLRELGELT